MKKRIKQRTAKANPHTPSPSLSKIPWAELQKYKYNFGCETKFASPVELSALLLHYALPLLDSRKLEMKESESHNE